MEAKTHLSELHQQLTQWLKDFNFYEDEVKVFNKRLEEVVKQNTNQEILAHVEHFQNQFIRQREVIDILKHNLKKEEGHLVANAQNNPIATDHRTIDKPTGLIDEVNTFLKLYEELKVEFESFLSKTL